MILNSCGSKAIVTFLIVRFLSTKVNAFQSPQARVLSPQTVLKTQQSNHNEFDRSNHMTRRSIFDKGSKLISAPLLFNAFSIIGNNGSNANAMVGSLAEFSDSNAVLKGISVDVSDLSQQNGMIEFLQNGFNFKILRQRKIQSVTETWMGFGPEEMKMPENFEIPVSSFGEYGGHSAICIRYDSQTMDLFYKKGDDAPGDNIAYLQVGVPEYRISQMVKTGGNILDAYGIVNVVSPSGLPMRGIIGISPDPMMFVALNCQNVKQSREFYEQLGFAEQEYPYCRPNKGMGQFEPPQPKNSVYLAPSKNSMGVLLLQAQNKRKTIRPNPVFRSMNIVYTPSEGTVVDNTDMKVMDPSGASISFQPYEVFEREELSTRFVGKVVE